ncbi:MAG TPA: sulfatase [Sedimentisphaerales bacterium]|nr:sulfatase [Sedimentisphaerales bacterium]
MYRYIRKPGLALVLSAISALGIFAGSALHTAGADSGQGPEPGSHTNVILITISTLRADHLSCFGYNRRTTPNFDSFARTNALFRNAFAASGWMMPAHGSIFTSLYPTCHGATHVDQVLADNQDTLAEILHDNGYYCMAFCCNPRLDSVHGFAQGFDLYDDYSVSIMLDSMGFETGETVDINKRRTNDFINDAAIRWLRNNAHQPFFMFVHYYDNHWDYLPPPPYDKLYDPNYGGPINGAEIAREPLFSNPPPAADVQHIIDLYDGEVKQTDNDLGEMLQFLRQQRLLDNSIVIVAGDHGEQFYEHGHTSHQGLFEELIHVPLAVSVPGPKAEGKNIDSLVSQVDILPTILDYLGIPVSGACQGKSLKPLIEGRADTVNDVIFAEYTAAAVPDCYVVRSARYKYYEGVGEGFAYDLLKDPNEQKKILPVDFPQELGELQQNMQKFRQRCQSPATPGQEATRE